jgi:hypothetical protein
LKKAIPLQLEVVSTGSIHPCLESELKYNYGYFLHINCKGRLAQLVKLQVGDELLFEIDPTFS